MVKVVIKGELYLYYNGQLIYKRWIGNQYGKVFHNGEGLSIGRK